MFNCATTACHVSQAADTITGLPDYVQFAAATVIAVYTIAFVICPNRHLPRTGGRR